jgi:hypothetical protein
MSGRSPREARTQFRVVSDLSKTSWAVISERGREAEALTYEDARRLVHRLAAEGRHGLCIITNDAVSRMSATRNNPGESLAQSNQVTGELSEKMFHH